MKSIMFLRATRVCVVLAAVLVASCGGGSGSSNANAPATGDIFVGSTNTPTAGEVVAGGVEGACAPFIDSFGREVSCSALKALPQTSAAAGIASCNNMVDGAGFEGGDGTGVGGGDGTAGDGAGIPNTPITITDVSGQTVRTTTDSEGYYRFSLCGLRPPLVAVVERADQPWKTMMVEEIQPPTLRRNFYTMNLTGLTDVVAAEVAKRAGKASSKDLDANDVALKKAEVPDVIAKINANIRQTLEATGLDTAKFNPLNVAFRPNEQGQDKVLQLVTVTSTKSTANVTSSTLMKVSLFTPNTLTLNQSTKVAVVGTDMTTTARLSIDGAICDDPTDYTDTGFSQTCKPTQSGERVIKVRVADSDVFQGVIRVTGSSAPIAVTDLSASQSIAGQPVNGSFTVSGSTIAMVRVHAGLSTVDTYCYQDLATSVGAKAFRFDAGATWINENGKSCSALLPAPGATNTLFFKVEARDNAGKLANNDAPPSVSAIYLSASTSSTTPLTVTGLTAIQGGTGESINGSFAVVASAAVSIVRVHARSTAVGPNACYIELSKKTGYQAFNFAGAWTNENGLNCFALLPSAGDTSTVYFSVEARDVANNLANNNVQPSVMANYSLPATTPPTPISAFSLFASQSSAGQPISGSFSVSAGATVTLVRLHASSTSAGLGSCYVDLPASPGYKTFSFNGSWTNENGLICADLLPSGVGSKSIYFKVEARDSANNLATLNVAASYLKIAASVSSPIQVTGLSGNQPLGPGKTLQFAWTLSSSLPVAMFRVHAGTSAGRYCYQDGFPKSTGTFGSGFSTTWTNENGKVCSTLIPAVGTSQTIRFEFEARDSAGNLANNNDGVFPFVDLVYDNTVAVVRPISINGLAASQSSAGQPIRITFNMFSMDGYVALQRIHAGVSATGPMSCYLDDPAQVGVRGSNYPAYNFNGSGWVNENGLSCAALLPAAGGTKTIYFKVEARDSAGNLANNGVPPTVSATYRALP